MPKGGPREGAGRPRGSRGKRTKTQSLKRRRSGRRRLRFCWSRCTPRAPRASGPRRWNARKRPPLTCVRAGKENTRHPACRAAQRLQREKSL